MGQANGTNQDLTTDILAHLENNDPFATDVAYPEVPQVQIKAALDRLASRAMVEYDTNDSEQVILTAEGQQIVDEGSHEYKVWQAVKQAGRLGLKDPTLATPSAKVGQGSAFKQGWIKKDGDALVSLKDEVQDATREVLKYAADLKTMPDAKQLKDYQKRKLVTTKKVITYEVRKGPRWAKEIPVEVTDLTAEMLEDGSWQTATFKSYNFKALGADQNAGTLHPLNKVREEFRKIFFNWDFIEMPTSRYVSRPFRGTIPC
jgi:phenylalanyl-tRNA synthetase alpha chain